MTLQPAQHQNRQPGIETEMTPTPVAIDPAYQGSEKLKGKLAIITGGDSGIGRSVALHFAKEGANVAIVYLNENQDATETQKMVEEIGGKCLLFAGDVASPDFCRQVVEKCLQEYSQIDILVNNAAEQHPQETVKEISPEQLAKTFETNIFGYFYMTQKVLPHMPNGGSIINTTSVTAYKGNPTLLDYSSTKGAIVAFTRSLSQNPEILEKNIRVNGVAPGPIWTPLIPSTFPPEKVANFGKQVPMKRAGQPSEVAPCFVFLASNLDSSYISGQVLHPNGGVVVNG